MEQPNFMASDNVFGKYWNALSSNGFDSPEVLEVLDEDQLQAMFDICGIDKIGHRYYILNWIVQRRGGPVPQSPERSTTAVVGNVASSASAIAASAGAATPQPQPQQQGGGGTSERRPKKAVSVVTSPTDSPASRSYTSSIAKNLGVAASKTSVPRPEITLKGQLMQPDDGPKSAPPTGGVRKTSMQIEQASEGGYESTHRADPVPELADPMSMSLVGGSSTSSRFVDSATPVGKIVERRESVLSRSASSRSLKNRDGLQSAASGATGSSRAKNVSRLQLKAQQDLRRSGQLEAPSPTQATEPLAGNTSPNKFGTPRPMDASPTRRRRHTIDGASANRQKPSMISPRVSHGQLPPELERQFSSPIQPDRQPLDDSIGGGGDGDSSVKPHDSEPYKKLIAMLHKTVTPYETPESTPIRVGRGGEQDSSAKGARRLSPYKSPSDLSSLTINAPGGRSVLPTSGSSSPISANSPARLRLA